MKASIHQIQPYLWPVGPGGLVATDHVVAVGRWKSAPVMRSVSIARRQNRLIDLTYGKACLWVLFLDSGQLVLISETVPVTAVEDSWFDKFMDQKEG